MQKVAVPESMASEIRPHVLRQSAADIAIICLRIILDKIAACCCGCAPRVPSSSACVRTSFKSPRGVSRTGCSAISLSLTLQSLRDSRELAEHKPFTQTSLAFMPSILFAPPAVGALDNGSDNDAVCQKACHTCPRSGILLKIQASTVTDQESCTSPA